MDIKQTKIWFSGTLQHGYNIYGPTLGLALILFPRASEKLHRALFRLSSLHPTIRVRV